MHKQTHFFQFTQTMPVKQHGAVLIVSLVLLVILTLLGVSMMNSTKLESRMAANTQESLQAFQNAETGLSQGYDNTAAWDINTTAAQTTTTIPGSSAGKTSEYVVSYIATTGPPSGYDVSQFQTAHFDFSSTGTNSNYQIRLHGGGYQVYRLTGTTN